MRAAVLHEYGDVPRVEDHPAPEDGLDVLAAGLNPIDLRLASGTLPRSPDVPYVVGSEGIARTADGRRVYFDSGASLAERATVQDGVDVPDGVDDAHALCYGIAGLAAWLSLWEKAQVADGEIVLVLGASGVVGLIGVQAAKLLGAGKVIAAARSQEGLDRAAELGADATVTLEGDRAALTEAFQQHGDIDVVLDPLWGEPAAAAVDALAFRGRLVQLGQSAGGEAALSSASVRFKELSILGHTNFAAPAEVRARALQRMWAHAAAGELVADYETVPLEQAPEAWERQARSPGRKLVVVPG